MNIFSVIIAAYQAETTIERAVRSAMTQTFPPHEVIVCDDGSTDRTGEVLDRFAPEVVVIHQANHGLSAARNTVGRAATGEWVVLLDADDEWLPGRLIPADGVGLVRALGVEAVRAGDRRGCLRAASDPALSKRLRIKFALAAVCPRLATRCL